MKMDHETVHFVGASSGKDQNDTLQTSSKQEMKKCHHVENAIGLIILFGGNLDPS